MNALIIANTQIRRDPTGRYCLNDLHQASGGEQRHKPGNWLQLAKTQELVAEVESQQGVLEIQQAPVQTVNDGFGNGTYAVKELVYAYAMWISAKFHLAVIRAYDALVTGAAAATPSRDEPLSLSHRADVLVSADRTFRAAMRSARSMRVPFRRAMQQARAITLDRTGVDLVAEIIGDEHAIAEQAEALSESRASVAAFYLELVAGRLPFPALPALSISWWSAYRWWCHREQRIATGSQQAFVQTMVSHCAVGHARKRYRVDGVGLGPSAFLMVGTAQLSAEQRELRNRLAEPDWLGRCHAEVARAIKHQGWSPI